MPKQYKNSGIRRFFHARIEGHYMAGVVFGVGFCAVHTFLLNTDATKAFLLEAKGQLAAKNSIVETFTGPVANFIGSLSPNGLVFGVID